MKGLSLHPKGWAGRPKLCNKTLKKFPNIGLNADNQAQEALFRANLTTFLRFFGIKIFLKPNFDAKKAPKTVNIRRLKFICKSIVVNRLTFTA
jgi:hypothetical protein